MAALFMLTAFIIAYGTVVLLAIESGFIRFVVKSGHDTTTKILLTCGILVIIIALLININAIFSLL